MQITRHFRRRQRALNLHPRLRQAWRSLGCSRLSRKTPRQICPHLHWHRLHRLHRHRVQRSRQRQSRRPFVKWLHCSLQCQSHPLVKFQHRKALQRTGQGHRDHLLLTLLTRQQQEVQAAYLMQGLQRRMQYFGYQDDVQRRPMPVLQKGPRK